MNTINRIVLVPFYCSWFWYTGHHTDSGVMLDLSMFISFGFGWFISDLWKAGKD